jgi:hypothetical protein
LGSSISHTRRQAELKIVIGSGFAHASNGGSAVMFISDWVKVKADVQEA